MKKRCLLLLLILLFVYLLIMIGYSKQNLQFDIGDAEKITVFSGSTGRTVEVMDKETIKHITKNINSLNLTKEKSAKGYDGYTYHIAWYDAEGKLMESIIVMSNGKIRYNDYFYLTDEAEGTVDMDDIDGLFKN